MGQAGTGGAVSSASSRLRPAGTRNSRHNRSPARQPSSTAIDRNHPFKPGIDLRYRSESPSTCSTKVLREQLLRSQKYLRTRNRITTPFEPNGRSARRRRYELCAHRAHRARRARHRQSGHRTGRPATTASTTDLSATRRETAKKR
ncbi:hypothetical protein RVR_9718 [Actinacidiphila reveromycinica]|uniref:Uncharacterized protein n=1 Tax=Actinacidiphila reveromycinica TaxID=659352 RepID=A0A7U3V046_9ACTN|nr:hypothetical protein RVR_9718 [Streptomyces sp. SN-593]